MAKYIKQPIKKHKNTEDDDSVFDVPVKQPKSIRVKTLVIIGVFILTHLFTFWVGTQVKDWYNQTIDRAVEARLKNVEATHGSVEEPELKANQ